MIETRLMMSSRHQDAKDKKFRDQMIRITANTKTPLNVEVELKNTVERLTLLEAKIGEARI